MHIRAYEVLLHKDYRCCVITIIPIARVEPTPITIAITVVMLVDNAGWICIQHKKDKI